MTFDIYVPLKISEKEQAKIDEALKNGYDDRSKFIRDCINNYDMNTEEMKLRAELRGYNACVTEINTNRDIVLQKLKSVTNTEVECYDVTQNNNKSSEEVTQSNTNSEETVEEVTPKNQPQNQVTLKNNTNPEETVEEVTLMTDDPKYPLYKKYLPNIAKQIALTGNWAKEMKNKMSEETATSPKEVVSFLYQYKTQIMALPFDEFERVHVEKSMTK